MTSAPQSSGSQSLKPLANGLLAIFSCVICKNSPTFYYRFSHRGKQNRNRLVLSLRFQQMYPVVLVSGHGCKPRLLEDERFKIFRVVKVDLRFRRNVKNVKSRLVSVH